MSKKEKNSVYVRQIRRNKRPVKVLSETKETVYRKSQHHHDLIKRNIADGCTSTTSLFDDECGEVPDVFNPNVSRFELADKLLREGATKQSQKVASDGVSDVSDK